MTPERSRDDLLAALAAERDALLDLLPRFSEERWRSARREDGWSPHDIAAHLADSTYGLALMVLGEIQPSMPLGADGWMQVDELNEQRRQRNAALAHEKVVSRMASAFDHARRAIAADGDLAGPGPYGPVHTRGFWLGRIVDHAAAHRAELAQLLDAP